MNIAVIIPAAGASRRFGEEGGLLGARSKLDELLGGRPVLQRTVELFTKLPEVALIVVAGPAADDAWDEFRLRHVDKIGLLGAVACRGGATHRYETVANALKVVQERVAGGMEISHVAVHDAARPCALPELIDRILTAAQRHSAVIPAVDVPDTLKRVGGESTGNKPADAVDAILGGVGKPDSAARMVAETVDRTDLVCVQTPQLFEYGLLVRAYGQDDLSSTDDAQLVERLGEPVATVKGDARNIKITVPGDMPLARAILGVREDPGRATHKRF